MEHDAGIVASRAAARAVAERGASLSGSAGEVELKGAVDSVVAAPIGTGRWQVNTTVRVELHDPARGGRLVAHATVADTEQYTSGDDVEGSDASRRVATIRLIERAVATAIDRLAP